MNRSQYDVLRKQVQSLEHKLKDSIDDHSHADARWFKDKLRDLEDNLQVHKSPRTIEQLVKQLEQAFNNYDNLEVMNQNEINFFVDKMRDMRQDLRQFDNY